MFDIAWSELLVLAVVTLIFVGPKELPRLLATVGRYVGVLRRQANEFRAIFDQALREAELDEMKDEMVAMRDQISDVGRAASGSDTATAGARAPAPPSNPLPSPDGSKQTDASPAAGSNSEVNAQPNDPQATKREPEG